MQKQPVTQTLVGVRAEGDPEPEPLSAKESAEEDAPGTGAFSTFSGVKRLVNTLEAAKGEENIICW